MKYNQFDSSALDAGLGLIFRLNRWWDSADRAATGGDYHKWEIILDCIYRNLLYAQDLELKEDEDKNVLDIKLTEEDQQVRQIAKEKIIAAKLDLLKAHKSEDENKMLLVKKAQAKYYLALELYDISVRKFMRKLGLYLKISDSNPSHAMWGG